jgi:hypothetical protein
MVYFVFTPHSKLNALPIHRAVTGQCPEKRIVAQLFLMVEVFVVQRLPVNTLHQQLGKRMPDARRIPSAGEAILHPR